MMDGVVFGNRLLYYFFATSLTILALSVLSGVWVI